MSTFFQEYTKYTSGLTARADQLEHERDLLGQALGECIEAAGITNPGVALTGPQLLLFAEDLKAHIGGLRGQLADTAVPMQPLVKDAHGVARFKANKIVNHLLDYASERGCGMTELAKLQFPDEDYMQFAQLIGYSDLSYVSDDSRGLAYAKLESLINDPSAQTQPSPAPELPERGTQHRFSTNEQNCRHSLAGVWWNDNGETKTGRECRHCGFFVADVAEAAAEQAEAERPEVVAFIDTATDNKVHFHATAWDQRHRLNGAELMTVAQHDRIAGALLRQKHEADTALAWATRHYQAVEQQRDAALARAARLEKELAMARDAASKGDDARHAAGGMEMEIQELREKVTELQKELRSRWTYASTQATNCAGCGEHKHTPLRVDWMGGYVCLTCIDEKLEELHDDQDQRSVPEGFREKFEQCVELAFAEINDYVSPEKACNPQSRARRASALATELRAMLASSEES
ncbi:hypothetical protein [Pseudomonas aeruginosa]